MRHDDTITEEEARILAQLEERRADGTEIRLDAIEKQIAEIRETVNGLDAKLTTILEMVDSIMGQAGPVIKQISESPMVKMLTGGK